MGVVIFFISVVIASMLFFVNLISLLKKIKAEEQYTANNTVIGAILIGYIVYGLLIM